MVVVRVVQVVADEVVEVVAVRNCLVAAARPVAVVAVVLATPVVGGAVRGVGFGHRECVLVPVAVVRAVQVAVVEIVDVIVVPDRRVAAAGPVLMLVQVVNFVVMAHGATVGRSTPVAKQAGVRVILARLARPRTS